MTSIAWPASYNSAVPAIMRTPPTLALRNFADNIMCTQGQSFIQERNTQYNLSPGLTLMRGRHRFHVGLQLETGYDNYAQTNVASGALILRCWPTLLHRISIRRFPVRVCRQLQQFSKITSLRRPLSRRSLQASKRIRRSTSNDVWHARDKLTLSLGLRYEQQAPWSERFIGSRISTQRVELSEPVLASRYADNQGRRLPEPPGTRNKSSVSKKQRRPAHRSRLQLGRPKTVVRSGTGFLVPSDVSLPSIP